MNVKRYFAPTAREALRALKAELGADAIVLSNRSVNGGVEILALPADEVGALQQPSARPASAAQPQALARNAAPQPAMRNAAVAQRDEDEDCRVSLSQPAEPVIRPFTPRRIDQPKPLRPGLDLDAQMPPRQPARAATPRTSLQQDMRREMPRMRSEREPFPAAAEPSIAAPAPATQRSEEDARRIRELQEANDKLMAELSSIRGMLERQLAGFAWGEIGRSAPARTKLIGELLEAGFSAGLARRLTEGVQGDIEPEAARNHVRTALNRNMRVLASDHDIIEQGGVFALVGPTGVGKTTTTAKLAARCVVRHGADKLALITTDGYRIGAHEQLRIYGRILGVPVFAVRDAADLRQTLAELKNKHMVLIDTVGVSQRDRMVAEQASMLFGAGKVRRLLVLNATVRGDTLDDVVRAYDGPDLVGCILSKVDEAASLAPVVDVAVRHELDIFYVANGQRVPEDLHLPNRAYLLHRALKALPEGSPYRLDRDEAGMLMAAGGAGV